MNFRVFLKVGLVLVFFLLLTSSAFAIIDTNIDTFEDNSYADANLFWSIFTNYPELSVVNATTMIDNYYLRLDSNTAPVQYARTSQLFIDNNVDYNFVTMIRASNVAGTTPFALGSESTTVINDSIAVLEIRASKFQYEDETQTAQNLCGATPSADTNYIFLISYRNNDINAYYSVSDNAGVVICDGNFAVSNPGVVSRILIGQNNANWVGVDNIGYSYSLLQSITVDFNTTYYSGLNYADLNGSAIIEGSFTPIDWNWLINGSTSGINDPDSQNTFFSSITQNVDYNICLSVGAEEDANTDHIIYDSKCSSVVLWDSIVPTIIVDFNYGFGFGADKSIDYNFTCVDNSSLIGYKIVLNDSNVILDVEDANNTLLSDSVGLGNGAANFVFTCTDLGGNVASFIAPSVFAVTFQLVNESTGDLLTSFEIDNNFSIVRVYSVDGNYSYNFKDNNVSSVSAVLPALQFVFNYGYNDASLTQLNRVIDVSLDSPVDSNMRICAPLFQQFYEQQFVSYTQKAVTLYNYVANCYAIQGELSYLTSSNYGLTTYTIKVPYYLFDYPSNGAKTFFSLINGGEAQAYNLDVILLTRESGTFVEGIDGLGALPLINPLTNVADLNILSIEYLSGDSNNTSVNMSIYDGSTLLFSLDVTDVNSVNGFSQNWYWGGVSGVDSSTYFKIVVTAENPNGQKITTITVNAGGTVAPLNLTIGNVNFNGALPVVIPIFALIVSSLFFIFGLSIASSGNTFGLFGILAVLCATAIAGLSTDVWYVSVVIGFYVMTLLFILLVGKPKKVNIYG